MKLIQIKNYSKDASLGVVNRRICSKWHFKIGQLNSIFANFTIPHVVLLFKKLYEISFGFVQIPLKQNYRFKIFPSPSIGIFIFHFMKRDPLCPHVMAFK